MELIDFFMGKMRRGEGATPLPSDMPLSALPHPNIGAGSDIFRQMAGLPGMAQPNMPWGFGQGTPFQYQGLVPPSSPHGANRTPLGPPPLDPYDPRSIRKEQLRQQMMNQR